MDEKKTGMGLLRDAVRLLCAVPGNAGCGVAYALGNGCGDHESCSECVGASLATIADRIEREREELDKRLMPEGMEWPRFEGGEKVKFGDEYENSKGNTSVASRFGFKADEYLVNRGTANGWEAYGKRVKRPKPAVIAADGLPIREGETVYAEFSGSPLVVERIEGAYLLDAGGTMLRADCATHTPPDTQERIDDDATMPPRAYYAKHIGHDVGLKDDAECIEAMVRHLLNRQRGLDGRTMGGAK